MLGKGQGQVWVFVGAVYTHFRLQGDCILRCFMLKTSSCAQNYALTILYMIHEYCQWNIIKSFVNFAVLTYGCNPYLLWELFPLLIFSPNIDIMGIDEQNEFDVMHLKPTSEILVDHKAKRS